ncbi:MAG: hypothetical protein AVDCRST_MAG86-1704, partial [uncultured Truepera sp.]
ISTTVCCSRIATCRSCSLSAASTSVMRWSGSGVRSSALIWPRHYVAVSRGVAVS